MDITSIAKHIISTNYKSLALFLLAGGIYFFMIFTIHDLVKYLEKKYSF